MNYDPLRDLRGQCLHTLYFSYNGMSDSKFKVISNQLFTFCGEVATLNEDHFIDSRQEDFQNTFRMNICTADHDILKIPKILLCWSMKERKFSDIFDESFLLQIIKTMSP